MRLRIDEHISVASCRRSGREIAWTRCHGKADKLQGLRASIPVPCLCCSTKPQGVVAGNAGWNSSSWLLLSVRPAARPVECAYSAARAAGGAVGGHATLIQPRCNPLWSIAGTKAGIVSLFDQSCAFHERWSVWSVFTVALARVSFLENPHTQGPHRALPSFSSVQY